MMFKYIHTIKYLKFVQIIFLVARKFNLKTYILPRINVSIIINKNHKQNLRIQRSSFNNLNLHYSLEDVMLGKVEQKLYLYNLFYLNSYSDKLYLNLHEQNYLTKSIFLEPYYALRIVNILYYSDLTCNHVIKCLNYDVQNLSLNIEFELDGNHLLENYLALSLYEQISKTGSNYTKRFLYYLKLNL